MLAVRCDLSNHLGRHWGLIRISILVNPCLHQPRIRLNSETLYQRWIQSYNRNSKTFRICLLDIVSTLRCQTMIKTLQQLELPRQKYLEKRLIEQVCQILIYRTTIFSVDSPWNLNFNTLQINNPKGFPLTGKSSCKLALALANWSKIK